MKKMGRPVLEPIERFWKLTKVSKNGCIEWIGTKERYGKFRVSRNEKVWSHRWIMKYIMGSAFIDELMVLHRCDNTLCVNPEHLFQGTAKDNYDDMVSKGRRSKDYCFKDGHESFTSKLSEKDVKEIRKIKSKRYDEMKFGKCFSKSYEELSIEYGVSVRTLRKIVRKDIWKKVED